MSEGGAPQPWREPWLRAILRCPVDHAELIDGHLADAELVDAQLGAAAGGGVTALLCTHPGHSVAYPVRGGVPVLLADDAVPLP